MKEIVWDHEIMVPNRTELFIRCKCLQQSEIGRKFAARKPDKITDSYAAVWYRYGESSNPDRFL